jgi:hypothetical protein
MADLVKHDGKQQPNCEYEPPNVCDRKSNKDPDEHGKTDDARTFFFWRPLTNRPTSNYL